LSTHKKYKWHKLIDNEALLQWQANNMCIVEVNNKTITIAKHNNQLFAFAHKCPHAGGIMADGFIDALGNVACPLHRYKFSLQNGRNVTGEGYFLKIYQVEIKEDGVYIGFEEGGLFSFFN
jgi:nitrite reductase/ring-hydroxylating ferredoxin subunit